MQCYKCAHVRVCLPVCEHMLPPRMANCMRVSDIRSTRVYQTRYMRVTRDGQLQLTTFMHLTFQASLTSITST